MNGFRQAGVAEEAEKAGGDIYQHLSLISNSFQN
jgi:hypothetical protein